MKIKEVASGKVKAKVRRSKYDEILQRVLKLKKGSTLLVDVPEDRSAEAFRGNISNSCHYHLPEVELHFFVTEDGKQIGIEKA